MNEANKKDTPKLLVRRSRSDSAPLCMRAQASCSTATDAAPAEGNFNLSKRWRSWSCLQSQYGIPLGTLTAREAAKCFWNSDMLKHRLEKIAECAALETSSPDDDDDDELEKSTVGEQTILIKDSTKVEDHSASKNSDDLAVDRSTPQLIPIPEQATEEDWEDLEQSSIRLNIDDVSCNSRTDDGLLVVQSAPSLTQGQPELFPSTLLSHSAHIL